MSYLLRVVLPDQPGSLGALASALGEVGVDIVSLDVVERGPDGAVDDMIVEVPRGGLADRLLTAAQSVPGVTVESLRPYLEGGGVHRDLQLVDELAARPEEALALLTELAPGVFRAGWALLLERVGPADVRLRHASVGAPDLSGQELAARDRVGVDLPWLPLPSARRLDRDDRWVPPRWDTLGMELVAAPVGAPDQGILLGRPGGPRFRASEVLRLAHLAGITATVARAAAPLPG